MNEEILKKINSSIGSLVLTCYNQLGMDAVSARKKIFSIFLERLNELLLGGDLTIEQKNEIKEYIYIKVGEILGGR